MRPTDLPHEAKLRGKHGRNRFGALPRLTGFGSNPCIPRAGLQLKNISFSYPARSTLWPSKSCKR